MFYSISHIASIINATASADSAATISQLLIDSRKIYFPATSLFFALQGPRQDGHRFIPELYEKGVRCFVVNETIDTTLYKGAVFLKVADTLQALQELAAYHRRQFHFPVIGITGSNGKTIVKEWLYQLLQEDREIVRSPKSYNSQVGVPLSVWQMQEGQSLGIFEAGISQPGEMEQLEKIIQPSIGLLTNIGDAHADGFAHKTEKIEEKLKLFTNVGTLVYGADDERVKAAVLSFKNAGINNKLKLFSWGKKDSDDLRVLAIDKTAAHTKITVSVENSVHSFHISFTDDASIENSIAAYCILFQLRVPHAVIEARMPLLKAVEMRLELKQGINNTSLINDSYSADINSLIIALDFLQQQQQYPKRTLILGDILQSGKTAQALYEQVAFILEQKKIDRFIGIGPGIYQQQEAFKKVPESVFFLSTAEFKQQFHGLHFHRETILLKGARAFEFEQLGHLLEQKIHQTVLEINLNAVSHNLKQYQQLLKPSVKLMAMVKAFSYGSGSFEIANLLQFHKVDYLAVAYADEGVELRKSGIKLPIMVMNAEANSFDTLLQYNLEPELYDFNLLRAFEQYLQASGITLYPVHIKLDTGMRRLGFETADIPSLADHLLSSKAFRVQSVFSHLAGSDAADHDDFTNKQAASLRNSVELLKAALGYPFLTHLCNTAAIHRHPELQFDMVRLGIGLYGVDSNAGMQQKLQNVTTLKTTVSQIKHLQAGESVGYSRKGIAVKDTVIATVRIGYADGYPRLLSNGVGSMLVNGQMASVIGNVCMDMTMLDITGIDVSEGDEVIVFGAGLPVSDVAAKAQTIAYEILTGISQRVQRVYFEE